MHPLSEPQDVETKTIMGNLDLILQDFNLGNELVDIHAIKFHTFLYYQTYMFTLYGGLCLTESLKTEWAG